MLSYAGGVLGLGSSLGHAQRAAMAQSAPPTRGGTLVAAGAAIGDNFDVHSVPGRPWRQLHGVRRGRIYTFQLCKGVKFRDGTPFNAEAVEFNYMRYLDNNHLQPVLHSHEQEGRALLSIKLG
jgi:hypothetical protein